VSSLNLQAWSVGNHTRLYYIDAFNVTLARPAPRILLCSRQAAGPFGTAIGLASVEAVTRRVPTNMDHHAMRVGRVRAPSRVDVPPAVGRLEVGHAVVRLSARDADQTGAAVAIWNAGQAGGIAELFVPGVRANRHG